MKKLKIKKWGKGLIFICILSMNFYVIDINVININVILNVSVFNINICWI